MIFDSNILSDKQKDQLKMYYFNDMTLNQIGEKFGVTREAIRQNIKTSIKKLQETLV